MLLPQILARSFRYFPYFVPRPSDAAYAPTNACEVYSVAVLLLCEAILTHATTLFYIHLLYLLPPI